MTHDLPVFLSSLLNLKERKEQGMHIRLQMANAGAITSSQRLQEGIPDSGLLNHFESLSPCCREPFAPCHATQMALMATKIYRRDISRRFRDLPKSREITNESQRDFG